MKAKNFEQPFEENIAKLPDLREVCQRFCNKFKTCHIQVLTFRLQQSAQRLLLAHGCSGGLRALFTRVGLPGAAYSTSRGAVYPVLATILYLIALPLSSLTRIGSWFSGLISSTLMRRTLPSRAWLEGL